MSQNSTFAESSQQTNPQANNHASNTRKQSKLFWTAKMERAALELYVQAVRAGKRTDNGFKPETHRSIALELRARFPTVDLDDKKVKSKFNQGFKKDYDTFVDLWNASGFGWNNATYEVTAPDWVWENYILVSDTLPFLISTPPKN